MRLYKYRVVREFVCDTGSPALLSPSTISSIFNPLLDQCDREHVLAVYLNNRNHVAGFEVVSVGTVNSGIVHPREVFKGAILYGASSIVLVHNHPSGSTDPSKEDLRVTRTIKTVGETLGIPLLDHVIVAGGSYYSFADAGWPS